MLLYVAFALLWSLAHNPIMNWHIVGQYMFKDLTLRGLVVTIELTVIAMVIGILGGTLLAVMRLSDNPGSLEYGLGLHLVLSRNPRPRADPILGVSRRALYPRLFCGLPFTGIVFGSAQTSSVIGAFMAGILALGLNEAAYASELVRSGIISVDSGQRKAALSLGHVQRIDLAHDRSPPGHACRHPAHG